MSTQPSLPVLIVGAGPIGLVTALALSFYKIPFQLFEEDGTLSLDTKAGTILTRTLEAFRRYGVADDVLARALRIDEIGSIERATNIARDSVRTDVLRDETRYPFVINLPQHHLEPILAAKVEASPYGQMHKQHRLTRFDQQADRVVVHLDTPDGPREVEGSYLLACDGGRSVVRQQMGVEVEGKTLDVRYLLVDFKVDFDVQNARDYPYLAYFSDPEEWMILVRHPHCWRFLFPIDLTGLEPDEEQLRAKVRRFIGDVANIEYLGKVVYRVHHRIASSWKDGRVMLMGDAAHLITPMWALGLNTGVLDAINLPWRLAWVLRGWADAKLLTGYEREQHPIAANGSGELAESARLAMSSEGQAEVGASGDNKWGNACTRTMLGVSLDVTGNGGGSMVKRGATASPIQVGDRFPDWELHDASGRALRLHDLTDDSFVALYFTDARRRPAIAANTSPALQNFLVSRWDAPLDSGLRESSLLDPGSRLFKRLGIPADTLVLIRPDDHIAAICPMASTTVDALYKAATGSLPPTQQNWSTHDFA
ncbi:FAD-dependent monooxygenase [Paraburkholderia sp.]|uniref:FAD-dependent monooxygenase n=1 Tax=Paraburkholderia sp. TaxID=1926495 RepID=UPI003D6DD03C